MNEGDAVNEKKELKINVGGSSIILVILVFALVIFAVLSIKASNNDLKLAKKTAASVQSYYQADAKAEEILMKLDDCIEKAKTNNEEMTLKETLAKVDDTIKIEDTEEPIFGLTYEVQASDTSVLRVILKIDAANQMDEVYQIQTWKIIQSDIGEYDFTGFEFWDGSIE